ncbi:MAG: alpha-amylase family protein [Chitinophagaceae bacterium]
MIKYPAIFLLLLLPFFKINAQVNETQPWWKQNNLRVIQTNLPDYEAATLNPDSLLADLIYYSANTLLINAGGIMAFYPTKLDFQYTNPYMKPNMLVDVIKKCHQHNIKVIVRFDFSRVQERVFKAHPDWCYISPKGERIINRDMYVAAINAPYVQEKAFAIIAEVMDNYAIDGIFLNMPGYQVNNPYEGKYHGIDQNEYDKKRFADWSGGLALPVEENKADTLFQKYLAFKKLTVEDWSHRLHNMVKAKNKQVAICTYSDKYVDIIRHESQASQLPYWPYGASDNVNNAIHSFPGHIISNASIQQISFQSRYNAVEPEETAIRLYENIANGAGLDMSMMGDMRGYEDERNFETFRKIYSFHQRNEKYFGRYKSIAQIAVIAPGSWPSGLPMQEYRGIQLMLKEAHLPFDIIEDAQLANLAGQIKKYRLILLPDITYLNTASLAVLKKALAEGTHFIATNTTMFDDPQNLLEIFGAKTINKDNDGGGNYINPENKNIFTRFKKQSMVSWKFNLGLYDFSAADTALLPILAKGRPGPPEIIGGHDPTGYYAMGIKKHGAGKAVLLPANIGRLYYQQGYEEHKNILLDIIQYIFPAADSLIKTNMPERVETILQQYTLNTAAFTTRPGQDGLILHLVNLTGFSGNTYFKPLPVMDRFFAIQCPFAPSAIFGLVNKQPVKFSWKNGYVYFTVKELGSFESIVINK